MMGGRPAIRSGNFTFTYDALSRRTQVARPNGVNTDYTYNALSRLLTVLHKLAGNTIDGATYTVDNVGNRTAKTNHLPSAPTEAYTYDAIYQLTQVVQNGSTTTESYTYDGVGNRLSSLGVSPYTYNSSNQLTARPNETYTYDNNGNTTTKVDASGTTTYTWDYENRLTQVTLPGSGGTVSFTYDPLGRRVRKITPTTTTVFAYDGANIIEETDSSGNAVARYAMGLSIDEPLAQLRSSATHYYSADGLGSVTSLTDSSGATSASYRYDTFGNLASSTGSVVNPFRYTARESDAETGLYFYRARYYAQTVGRFLSEDPSRFDAGINFYRYARNNPTSFRDPTGLYSLKGFPPKDAAQMSLAIGQLQAKLKSEECCVRNPEMRSSLLDLLQAGNYGAGVTFVYEEKLPAEVGQTTCAAIRNRLDFFTNTVAVSKAALDGTCECPLAGVILHEVVHLTSANRNRSTPEGQAYEISFSCFGPKCDRSKGITTP
jgi:RHS repeat-associated protein